MEGYRTFSDAKKACIKDIKCTGIFDVLCDGDLFWICKGNIQLGYETSDMDFDTFQAVGNKPIETCAWEKG